MRTRINSSGLFGPPIKIETSRTISEIAEELKKAAAELYAAQRGMRSQEILENASRLAAPRPNGTQLVILIYMSLAKSAISIAIDGCGITLEGSATERDARDG